MLIRSYARFGRHTGFTDAAEHLAVDLARAGVEVEAISMPAALYQPLRLVEKNIDWYPNESALAAATVARGHRNPDVVLVHTLAADAAEAARIIKQDWTFRSAPLPKFIAYTTWEALGAPQDLLEGLARQFDQVWVPSIANRKAFNGNGTGSPRIVPHCYNAHTPWSARGDGVIEGTRYRFYWIGAWSSRKNPVGLIRAFAHAFTPADPVDLHLHSPGARREDFLIAIASVASPAGPLMVTFQNQEATDGELAALVESSDCFVTAARGEAWNLPAFEAALARRHVIAPRGQGSDDFLLHTSARLYGSTTTPAFRDAGVEDVGGGRLAVVGGPFPKGMTCRDVWQEPDLLDLALAMKEAFYHRRRRLHWASGFQPADHFGYDAVAKVAIANMEEALRS